RGPANQSRRHLLRAQPPGSSGPRPKLALQDLLPVFGRVPLRGAASEHRRPGRRVGGPGPVRVPRRLAERGPDRRSMVGAVGGRRDPRARRGRLSGGGVLFGRIRVRPPRGPLRAGRRGPEGGRTGRPGVRSNRDAERRSPVRGGPGGGGPRAPRSGSGEGRLALSAPAGDARGEPSAPRPHVVVVGGGISGLAAAYRLIRSADGRPIDVTLLEASGRLGGDLLTVDLGDLPVEAGADSFVVRKPWAVELCKELGLGGERVVPAASGAFVWTRGRLIRYPEPSAFGIPASSVEILRWPGLSSRGRLRAATEFLHRVRRSDADESIGSMISRRMGP